MKIYIVTAGAYEDNHNVMATTDPNKAVDLVLKLPVDDCIDGFADIEVWEDGKLINTYDGCDLHFAKRDSKDIREDIINHFKRDD